MFHALRHHVAIARQFVRIGIIRKSQFRVEFLSQIVMDMIWYLFHILTFEILFLHTETIAGWSAPEARVFLGFLFVSDAFSMMWLGQAWHFGNDLKDGNLDPVRVRPAAGVFLYFFQRFSLEACFNMVIAAGYLGFALVKAGAVVLPESMVALPLALLLSFWGRVVLTVLYSIWELYFISSDLSQFSYDFFGAVVDRPLDIWPSRLRRLLILALPIGAAAHLPAVIALGRCSLLEALFHSGWTFVLGVLVFKSWNASFRRYESALG